MNISYSWLKDFLDFDLNPQQTADALTSIGLENGPVEMVESVKGGLEGLVVGQVLTCEAHPDSDHLHLTTVDVGQGEPLKIVCGAPNVAAGQKVIVATIGTKLYNGEESFTIKRSKIRGQESYGMLCAEDEIGIGTAHDGIIVLPEDTPVGLPAKTYYHLESQAVLEVDITPNRADATSHYGVARDLYAYLKSRGQNVSLRLPSVDAFKVDNHKLSIDVEVQNAEACPRYAGICLTNVKVKESPKWMQDRLRLIGLHPINNVVDITNYILHETGHPLHAFDADKIKGRKIVVRTAPGRKFVTLDGVERELHENDLMICNAEEPMCMAGVFGGLDSGVTESTTSVFIECAYFNPVWVRKTARRHGLNTDSSFRYERGIDPHNTLYVLKRTALLLKELADAEISSEIVDRYPQPIDDFKVHLSYAEIDALIGKHIEPATVKTILTALEMTIDQEENGALDLTVPAYRVDVQRPCDVIEDILRIYGYNNIEIGQQIKSTLAYTTFPDSDRLKNLISEQLTAAGFREVLNNSLTAISYYENLQTYPLAKAVKVINALSNDLGVLRQTLLFGGLENIARNRNRRQMDLKFYELGACYHYDADKRGGEDHLAPYSEETHLALWMCGNRRSIAWNAGEEKISIYDLKAHVLNIFSRLGIKDWQVQEADATDIYRHSLTFTTAAGKPLALIASVHPEILKQFGIDTEVFFADMQWPVLMKAIKNHKVSYSELPKYPEVRRDLALLLDKDQCFSQVEKIIMACDRKLIKSVGLFDVYEGKNLPEGKKSYAVYLILQDETQTLTDKRIDVVMNKIINSLKQQMGASLR